MSIFLTGGSKLFVGTSTSMSTTTAYAADTWNQVGEVVDVGEFGDNVEIVNFTAIGDSRVRKVKGVADAGNIEITVARDPVDLGQIALRSASASKLPVNIKIELTDKPSAGASPKNTIFYCAALVQSAKNELGGANDPTKQKFTLAIATEILTTIASAT